MQDHADDQLSPDLVRALRESLPGANAAQASFVGRGWDATAWRIPAADGDWLLRVPRHSDSVGVMEAQQHLGVLLAARGLRVPGEPRLLLDAGGVTVAGLYRFVHGRPAQVSGRAQRARLATSIARFLSALHPLADEASDACAVAPVRAWDDLFGPLVERCAGLLPPATEAWIRATGDRLERASRDLPPPVLVHADLKPEHVLLDAWGEIAGVLDFEGVQVTDPALDFSRLIQNWDYALALQVLAQYDGPVDAQFMVRAQCYRDFDALQVVDSALHLGWSEWLPWARRALAARGRGNTAPATARLAGGDTKEGDAARR